MGPMSAMKEAGRVSYICSALPDVRVWSDKKLLEQLEKLAARAEVSLVTGNYDASVARRRSREQELIRAELLARLDKKRTVRRKQLKKHLGTR